MKALHIFRAVVVDEGIIVKAVRKKKCYFYCVTIQSISISLPNLSFLKFCSNLKIQNSSQSKILRAQFPFFSKGLKKISINNPKVCNLVYDPIFKLSNLKCCIINSDIKLSCFSKNYKIRTLEEFVCIAPCSDDLLSIAPTVKYLGVQEKMIKFEKINKLKEVVKLEIRGVEILSKGNINQFSQLFNTHLKKLRHIKIILGQDINEVNLERIKYIRDLTNRKIGISLLGRLKFLNELRDPYRNIKERIEGMRIVGLNEIIITDLLIGNLGDNKGSEIYSKLVWKDHYFQLLNELINSPFRVSLSLGFLVGSHQRDIKNLLERVISSENIWAEKLHLYYPSTDIFFEEMEDLRTFLMYHISIKKYELHLKITKTINKIVRLNLISALQKILEENSKLKFDIEIEIEHYEEFYLALDILNQFMKYERVDTVKLTISELLYEKELNRITVDTKAKLNNIIEHLILKCSILPIYKQAGEEQILKYLELLKLFTKYSQKIEFSILQVGKLDKLRAAYFYHEVRLLK